VQLLASLLVKSINNFLLTRARCKSRAFLFFYPCHHIISHMKKNKLPVIETHAKVEDKFEPTLLEQVWGKTDQSRYGTFSEAEYVERVSNMTRADLEAHARQMGVVVVENSLRLRDKLVADFRSYVSLMQKPITAPAHNTKISDAALKVLQEGR
jgi:hypothetical protein